MKIQNSMLKKLTAILLVVAMMFSFSSVAMAVDSEKDIHDMNLAELIVAYYDDAYEYAYAYAGTNGYIDIAEAGIDTAIAAVNSAAVEIDFSPLIILLPASRPIYKPKVFGVLGAL